MIGSILANRSAADRNKTDYYRTPPDVTIALLDFLQKEERLFRLYDVIWEPACGTGEMVEAMQEMGYRTIYSDLYPTGWRGEHEQFNFLTDFMNPNLYDWIITNPPFSQAEYFIRRALELDVPFAFLLKSQFWHARKRIELFEKHPPAYVLPLTWRPDFLWGAKSGSPTMECIWTVWLGSDCITEYHPLRRPAVNPFDMEGV